MSNYDTVNLNGFYKKKSSILTVKLMTTTEPQPKPTKSDVSTISMHMTLSTESRLLTTDWSLVERKVSRSSAPTATRCWLPLPVGVMVKHWAEGMEYSPAS